MAVENAAEKQKRRRGGAHAVDDPTKSKTSAESDGSKKDRVRYPGLYEKNLFDLVRRDADRLLAVKYKVIALQHVESTAKFLEEAEKKELQQQQQGEIASSSSSSVAVTTGSNRELPRHSTFYGAPTFLHQFPRETVLANSGAFRRRFFRPSPIANKGAAAVSVWRGVRDYFIKTHGACEPGDGNTEHLHRCGPYLLSPRARKKARRVELDKRRLVREEAKALQRRAKELASEMKKKQKEEEVAREDAMGVEEKHRFKEFKRQRMKEWKAMTPAQKTAAKKKNVSHRTAFAAAEEERKQQQQQGKSKKKPQSKSS